MTWVSLCVCVQKCSQPKWFPPAHISKDLLTLFQFSLDFEGKLRDYRWTRDYSSVWLYSVLRQVGLQEILFVSATNLLYCFATQLTISVEPHQQKIHKENIMRQYEFNFVAKSNGNNLNNMSHTRFMRMYQDH